MNGQVSLNLKYWPPLEQLTALAEETGEVARELLGFAQILIFLSFPNSHFSCELDYGN